MKTLILIVTLAILSQLTAFTQGCLPEGITFTTQSQIDSFQISYPGCTEIEGNLIIANSDDINNLLELSILTSVGGTLSISCVEFLTNLVGLNNLISVGKLSLFYNNSLVSLNGLDNLSSIENGLHLECNNSLTDLTGLNGLTSLEGYNLIAENESLTSFSGLEGINSIGDIYIAYNPLLMSLSGFENVLSISGILYIINSQSLNDFAGLSNIVSIGSSVLIAHNNTLETFQGIDNLSTIGGYLNIFDNPNLTSLDGLGNIDPGSITDLSVYNNYSLITCDVQSICGYLIAPNGSTSIYNNAPGCNSPEEVQLACQTAVGENKTEELTLHPNPAVSLITLNASGDLPIEEAIIYNHLGQKVLTAKPVNNTLDVSGLRAGMYMIEVITNDGRYRTKMIRNY